MASADKPTSGDFPDSEKSLTPEAEILKNKSFDSTGQKDVERELDPANANGPTIGEFVIPERPDYYKSVTKSLNVAQLLKMFGMSAGFHLPFSTAENKALLEKLEAQQTHLLRLNVEIDETRLAVKDLKTHSHQSGVDIRFTQGLVDAKTSERDREENIDIVEKKAHEKQKRHMQRVKADVAEYNERNRIRLIDLEKRKNRMTELQEKIAFDKERLQIWKAASVQSETFLKLIMGHKEHDERQAWELETKQVDLGATNKKLKFELDKMAMNTTKLTEQYDRLSSEYRKEYKERKQMVQMWSSSLEIMKRKDVAVKEISKEYCEIRGRLLKVEFEIKEKEKIIEGLQWAIRKTVFDQGVHNRQVGEIREQLIREKEMLMQLKDEITLQKIVIQQTVIANQRMQTEIGQASARVQEFITKAKVLQEALEAVKKRYEEILSGKITIENYLNGMDEELQREEKLSIGANRELEKLRMFSWERTNEKKHLETQNSWMDSQHAGLKATITILQAKEYTSMEAIAKKQVMMYRLDLSIAAVESRMSKLQFDTTNPEYFKLQATLASLRAKVVEITSEKDFIEKEVQFVKDCFSKYTKDIKSYTKKQKALKLMVDHIKLDGKRMQSLLDSHLNDLKESTIQLSLEKLILNRLNDSYNINRGKVLSIAQRRATMEWAVRERKSEIEFAMQLLVKQRKELRGHTMKRRLAIGNIVGYCEKLKGRFELTTTLMAPSDGSSSGEDSMTFQIHKLAREREQLAAEKQRWESRLFDASRDLEGLTNVLLVMRNSNDAFRNNLAVASKLSEEALEVEKALKSQKKSVVIRNRCNKAKAALKITIDALEKQVQVTKQEGEDMLHIIDHKEGEASTKSMEHKRLQDRIEKWNHLLNKKTMQLKGKLSEEFLFRATLYLKSQMIHLKLQKGLEQLELTVLKYPFMKEIVYGFLNKHMMMEEFEKAQRTIEATSRTSLSKRLTKSHSLRGFHLQKKNKLTH